MTLTAQTFHDGDDQTGVLLRDEWPDRLATWICFALPDGAVYAAEQVTEVGVGPTQWSRFTFSEALTGTRTTGTRTGDGVVVDGVDGVIAEPDAVPSYLGHRVLVALAREGGDRAAFRQLDEHGDPEVHDAVLLRQVVEQVATPTGAVEALRYDLHLDGQPYTAFWWDGADVVVSDWSAGARSYLVPDLEAALAGCPVPVAERTRAWAVSLR